MSQMVMSQKGDEEGAALTDLVLARSFIHREPNGTVHRNSVDFALDIQGECLRGRVLGITLPILRLYESGHGPRRTGQCLPQNNADFLLISLNAYQGHYDPADDLPGRGKPA